MAVRARVCGWIFALALFTGTATTAAVAYDGIDAGLEAYERHDTTRRARVARQVDLSEAAKTGYLYDSWTWYDDPWPDPYWGVRGINPWDYRYDEFAPQPLGHRIIGGPDWGEYRPIFPEDVQPEAPLPAAAPLRAEPSVRAEELPRRRPPLRRYTGPREF